MHHVQHPFAVLSVPYPHRPVCIRLQLWVGRLLLYSSVLYLLTSLTVYCLYLPEEWLQRLAMALPFFIYPVL